jgi:hypothetical protein
MADESIPVTPDTTDTGATDGAVAPDALKGWAALQYGVNVLLPRDLTKAATIRAATLRVLRDG